MAAVDVEVSQFAEGDRPPIAAEEGFDDIPRWDLEVVTARGAGEIVIRAESVPTVPRIGDTALGGPDIKPVSSADSQN